MPLFFYRIFPPVWEKFLTVLLYGPRSAGKSLQQAKYVRKIFLYLEDLYKAFPRLPQAIVMSNQLFSTEYENKYGVVRQLKKVMMQRRLYYWESINQLKVCPREHCWKTVPRPDGKTDTHVLHDAYIIFDDIATIIPADGWQDLPKWFRKIFAQAGHNGVHCIANVQDPMSCDINFRRYVDVALKFRKILGSRRPEIAKPEVKTIWGIYATRRISAEELWRWGDRSEAEIKEMKLQNPELQKGNWNIGLHWIGRKATMIYNTMQNVPEYMPNSLEHIELTCTDPECKFVHTKHRVI